MPKKIERVCQEDGVFFLVGSIEGQDGGRKSFVLDAPLIAYIEDGFLTGDDEKWHFFDADGDLVKEAAPGELGDCWGIGCFAPQAGGEDPAVDFYIFEKMTEDGKKEIVYVRSDGEILVPRPGKEADNRIYGYPACLLVDRGPFEDWDHDYENNPECMRLSEAKKDCIANPPLDMIRIAADEARGIRFSLDKHTLIRYNAELTDKEYTIPNGVTGIGIQAFDDCRELTKVNIPDGVTTIGEQAFLECFNLTDIKLPADVTEIGNGAFDGCGKVSCSGNARYYTDEAGALFDRQTDTLLHFPGDFSGTYAIPDGVTCIGEKAFWQCDLLAHMDIPSSVTVIGDEAFAWCGSLTAIAIPSGVTDIADGAFAGCSNLTRAVLPNSLKSIGARAFFNCGRLADINIPDSVTTIGEWAFSGPCMENPEFEHLVGQKTKQKKMEVER